ncbi:cysteine proteinase [Coniochaeta ligniaria NRRL 30616]|uniref:ubiquitinyl hydrolase 1 n=1 Tax=Coniochaeta ligniaria NRRL 30616 TaxID=1408157 RepID=A0A1J7IU39_9PEZI|nr:cysteine proteinase [Coniochaeta ligniaria NRRL 30616]
MESDLNADLAAQEAAAREYQPHLEGPLVGDRTPSHVITEEYAKADPVYVQKTLALPQTYSHYRPVQGDGNCGWRAIGFGYFEALIRTGDASLVGAERDRITQYPILDHSEMVYEDMRDEVSILMNDIAAALPNQGAAMDVLVQKFNDLDVANHLLYYLRLLASSWLKGDPNANEYLGFIPEEIGIIGYCQNYLELPGREIEHLGIMLLYNVLLKPCGMVIEIAYLDRTPGPAVNTYRFPAEANGCDPSTLGPIMYLLFRPDHYDILYPHPPPTAPVDIQVNRASSFSHEHQITPNMPSLQNFTEVDLSALSLIPGLGLNPGVPSMSVSTASSIESYSPSPQSPWMPTPFTDSLPIRQQQPQLKQEQSVPSLRAVSVLPQPVQRQTPPLRFSEYCHPQLAETYASREPCFTTNTFKNSHFNTAHYNNPNFQPEEYRPELDDSFYEVARPTGKRRSH